MTTSCLVCLEDCNGQDDNSVIKNGSMEWQKYNVQRIIEKHLWWWHCCLTKNNRLQVVAGICRQCWHQIWSFHKFYLRVESVHKHYYNKRIIKPKLQLLDLKNTAATNVIPKMVVAEAKDETPLTEDLIPFTTLDVVESSVSQEDIKLEDMAVEEFPTGVNNEILNSTKTVSYENVQENNYMKCKSKLKRKPRASVKEKSQSSTQIVKEYDEFIANNYELFCSICHVKLTDFQNLKMHFQNEHEDAKAFATCCGLKFHKRAMLVDHLYTHQNPDTFKCQLCSKTLPNRRSLKTHLEWHNKSNKPQFQCPECNKVFFTKASCEKHKLSHVPENEKRISCTECDKKFASECLRLQHFNAAHLKKYAKICDTCGKLFSNREYFQRHLAEHTGIPVAPIECDVCGIKLTNIYGLNRHKKMRHTQENMQAVQCPHCSRLISNVSALRHHIEYAHSQRKHECNLCSKTFRRPNDLKEHLSTHTGETPYKCTHCPKSFRRHNKLYVHVKNLHPKEWEESRMHKSGMLIQSFENEK